MREKISFFYNHFVDSVNSVRNLHSNKSTSLCFRFENNWQKNYNYWQWRFGFCSRFKINFVRIRKCCTFGGRRSHRRTCSYYSVWRKRFGYGSTVVKFIFLSKEKQTVLFIFCFFPFEFDFNLNYWKFQLKK